MHRKTTDKAKIFFFLLFQCILFSDCNGYKYLELNNLEEGTLSERLEGKIANVSDLCLEGQTNQKDLDYLENIALESDALTILDLRKCDIVLRERAFAGCVYLKKIILPSVAENGIIPASIFDGCTSLEVVELPENCQEIGNMAFYNCNSLEFIRLPKDLTRIGQKAFKNCSKLAFIYCESSEPPICASNTFEDIAPNCTLVVPKGSVSKYKNSIGWEKITFITESNKKSRQKTIS